MRGADRLIECFMAASFRYCGVLGKVGNVFMNPKANAILHFIRAKQLMSAKRYAVEAQGQRFDIWEVIYYTNDLDAARR